MNRKKQVVTLFWIALVAGVLLTTAGYAWMDLASVLKVTNLELSIITENYLEIAADVDGQPGDWSKVISFEDLISEDQGLKPITYNKDEQTLVAPIYGEDGRISGESPDVVQAIDLDNPLDSSDLAENWSGSGYLIAVNFWLKSDATDCYVKLTEQDTIDDNTEGLGTFVVGNPEWNTSTYEHDNLGLGAENAIRVAFVTYNDYIDQFSDKATYFSDEETDSYLGGITFLEPNADSTGEYVTTNSGYCEGTLFPETDLITQSTSIWEEVTPILMDTLTYSPGVLNYYTDDEGNSDEYLFKLEAGEERLITMYIWLEGQDDQCINEIAAAELLMNFQFTVVTSESDSIVSR